METIYTESQKSAYNFYTCDTKILTMSLPISFISKSLSISEKQVSTTINLLEEKATVPFISRYRKEMTGGLDEVQIEKIQIAFLKFKELEKRKKTILNTISEQGNLIQELKEKIENSWDSNELEDLYLPFKPRRKSRADKAIELGLAPLAKMLMSQQGASFSSMAERFVKGELENINEAIKGAQDIAALWISERQYIRQKIRGLFWREGVLKSKMVKGKEEEGEKFKDYFSFEEPIKRIKSHRFLAIYRGQKEGVLKVAIEPPTKEAILMVADSVLKRDGDFKKEIQEVVKDVYTRLLKISIETEVKKDLKTQADVEAIKVFAENFRQLLLQSPLGGKRTLAIDPGFRSGCKVVCLSENGDLVGNSTIFPHPPQNKTTDAMKKISTMVQQYKIEAIALGNGTAGRETEAFIKRIRFNTKVNVYIVNEAGASIYSASKIAREEFPDYDVTVRGAVSIGRRLMDPLAELVKIDPKSIGVGQYQHDVDQAVLKQRLDSVVESSVNRVGVDVNTASKYILTYVSGIGPQIAENIVEYRKQNGDFTARKELNKVPKLGTKAFEQSAGFLRISNAENPLDNSAVHPESYSLVQKMAKDAKCSLNELIGNEALVGDLDIKNYITKEVGELTLNDLIKELIKPSRDPRKIARVFEFDKRLRSLADVEQGMEIVGIVNNVTNFGAIVDIGIKESGLIHISNLADSYVSNPADVVSVHQHVKAKVISIDIDRKRIGLKLL